MQDLNEKPKYSTLQNIAYVLNTAWNREKQVPLVMLAEIMVAVAAATVLLFLPKVVVRDIISGVSIGTLARTILLFTAATIALQAIKAYFDASDRTARIVLRMKICADIQHKTMTTDYANLETQAFTDGQQKAFDLSMGNQSSGEQIYYCLTNFGTGLLGCVVYVALLGAVSPIVLIATVGMSTLGVWVRRWANRWSYAQDTRRAAIDKRMWYLNDLGNKYSMAKDIRLFAMTDWLRDVYNSTARLSYDLTKRVNLKQFLADAVDCAATFLREGLAYGFLIWQVLYRGMPIDQFVLLFAAIGGLSGFVMGVLNEYSELTRHCLNFDRLRGFLEFPDTFLRGDGEAIAGNPGEMYALEMKDVSFRYPGSEENVLEHINLTIAPGEKLAVVGLNGAGKSTLVKLICGLYDPTEGAVLLNGRDIRAFNRDRYYALFTAVFQDFNILPETIADNVTQRYHASPDDERLWKCLELADLKEKIASLKDGANAALMKDINDDAVELSGGETQRLMLARALYKDAPILILDEPTAALDPIAESRLYEKYQELSHNRTSVYISHRLASTRFCDRIILIDDKHIIESGTHDQLIKAGGKYAELFAIQSKYYRDNEEGEGT